MIGKIIGGIAGKRMGQKIGGNGIGGALLGAGLASRAFRPLAIAGLAATGAMAVAKHFSDKRRAQTTTTGPGRK